MSKLLLSSFHFILVMMKKKKTFQCRRVLLHNRQVWLFRHQQRWISRTAILNIFRGVQEQMHINPFIDFKNLY